MNLPLPNFTGRKRTLAPFAVAVAAGLLSPSLAMAGASTSGIDALGNVSRQFAPAARVEAPRVHVAQSQEAAQLTVRIQQLEEQIRSLTGQVEGLQFQLTQMQTLIERQTEDNEFRFQQLEGGAGKKSDAATQSDGVKPSGALPQDHSAAPPAEPAPPTVTPEGGIKPLPGETEIDPTFDGGSAAPIEGGDAPMDDIGASSDPLVGTGQGETGVPLGSQLPQVDGTGVARPLDLSLDAGAQPANGDADAQYAAGYDAIVRGDYAFAEEQFRQFIALYPDDPNAADATNWLGEALIQRAAYDEAADVLLTGFQKYPSSTRAPDLLLKLGISLGGAGEVDTACRTFAEVEKRYTNLTPAFLQRLGEEKAKAKCRA